MYRQRRPATVKRLPRKNEKENREGTLMDGRDEGEM